MDLLLRCTELACVPSYNELFTFRSIQITQTDEGKVKVYVNGREPIEFDNIEDIGVTLWKSS